jgi:hypothetical protein
MKKWDFCAFAFAKPFTKRCRCSEKYSINYFLFECFSVSFLAIPIFKLGIVRRHIVYMPKMKFTFKNENKMLGVLQHLFQF